jgi:DNA-binding transcriptional LysR family regulator
VSEVRRFDANLLVVLDAILTDGNLTRVGERLGMMQPAVSGALARIRRYIDDPVLVRAGRTFELTEKAKALSPIVREAMVEVARTLEVFPVFDPSNSQRVFSICASDYVLWVITAPFLRLIAEQAPKLAVDFIPLPSHVPGVTASDLLRRDIVIAGTGRGVPGRRQTLFRDRFVCVVDSHHPRLVDGALSILDLREMSYCIGTFGGRHLTPADDLLAEAGITPKAVMSVRDLLAVPLMISGTDMIGMMPERLALRFGASLGLVIAETPLGTAELVEAAHWHPTNSSDPALRWLLEMLRQTAKQLQPVG